MKAIVSLSFLALAACGGSDSKKKGPGARISLEVDGAAASFSGAYGEFQEYLGGTHVLHLCSDEKGKVVDAKFLLAPVFEQSKLADLAGRSTTRDTRADNPERFIIKPDLNPNWFEVGDKFYQGWHYTADVTSVSGGRVTVSIDGTFLEAKIADVTAERAEGVKGREVRVRGTMTVPVRSDDSK